MLGDITIWGAFVAGLVSFVSPCVLPIVPPYLAFLTGLTMDELTSEDRDGAAARRVALSALAFVLGFSTVFVLLGASASVLGGLLTRYLDTLSIVAGIVILLFGLHFLGVFRVGLLYREARVQVRRKPPGLVGSYVVGLAFAFGWTPCVGPVLAAILFVAGAEQTAARGALLLFAYSLGIGLPFLLAAVFAGPFMGFMRRFRSRMGAVEKAMGGALVVTGVLFITGQMSAMAYWLLEAFPALGRVG